MPVILARIDDRLIHGQVTVGWSEALRPDRIILANNATLGGHVEVDDYAIIGGLAAVHQFVRIGAHAMVGGGGPPSPSTSTASTTKVRRVAVPSS